MKKRTKFTITLLFATMTTLTGCGIGNMVFKRAPAGNVIDVESKELQNTVMAKPEDSNIKPDDYIGDEIVNNLYIATGILGETAYWSSEAAGLVTASVGPIPYNQDVFSHRIINNDENKEWFFQTNTISTFVKKSEQRFGNVNSYLTRTGDNPSMEGADYRKDNIVGYSKDNYLNQYGSTSNNLSNYVLNDYSVVSGELVSVENGKYTYHYVLNPEYAAAKEMREVKYMAGAAEYPSFSQTEITIVIDDDWKVYEVKSHDVYNISIMGGLICSSELTDTFSYSASYQTIPEKEDFKDKFGTIDDNVITEKTALDYLSEAAAPLMAGGDSPLNIEAGLAVNGNILPIYISVDLKQMIFKVSFDDQAFIYYKDDQVYLMCGEDLNFLIAKDELLNLVHHYIPGFTVDNVNLGDLLEADFFKTMMDTMTLDKSLPSTAIITMTGDGMSVGLNLSLDENDTATFQSIDLTYTKDPLNLVGNIKLFTAEHTFATIPENLHEITNLNGLANSIDSFVDKKSLTGIIDLHLSSSILINGTYTIDYTDQEHIKGKIDLVLTYIEETIDISVIIDKQDIYLTIADKTIKMTWQEAGDLLFDVAADLATGQLDILSILDSLQSGFDFSRIEGDIIPLLDSLIKAIETNDQGLNVTLDLTSYQFSHEIALQYSYADSRFAINIADLGSITLVPGEKLDLNLPTKTDITASQLKQAVKMILDFEDTRKFDIAGSYDKDGTSFSLTGSVDFKNKTARGQIGLNIDGVRLSASFIYQNQQVVLQVADKIKMVLTVDEISKLSDKIRDILGDKYVDLPLQAPFSAPKIKIGDLLSSLEFNGDEIIVPFDLSSLGLADLSGEVKVTIRPLENKIYLAYDGLNLCLALNRNVLIAGAAIDDSYLNYRDMTEIIDGVVEMADKYHNISFDFEAVLDGKNYCGQGFFTIDPAQRLYTASLKIQDRYTVNLRSHNGLIYLDLNGIKIRGSAVIIPEISQQILAATNVDIPILNALISALEKDELDLKSLLSSIFNLMPKNKDIDLDAVIRQFSYADKNLSLDLTVNDQNVAANWDIRSGELTVTVGKNTPTETIRVSLSYGQNNEAFEISDADRYLDLDSLANVKASTIINLLDFISGKTYSLGGTLNLTFGGKNLSLNLNNSYLAFKNETILAEINMQMTVEDNVYSVQVSYVDGKIYLSLADKIYIADSVQELHRFFAELLGIDSGSNGTPTDDGDASAIIDAVSKRFNDIVKAISVHDRTIAVSLDLSSFRSEYLDLATGKLTYDEIGHSLNVNIGGLGDITIGSCEEKSVSAPGGEYLSTADLLAYVDNIKNFLDTEKYQATFTLQAVIVDQNKGRTTLTIGGKLLVDIRDKFDFSLAGTLYYGHISSSFALTKIGSKFFIEIGKIRLALSTEELFALVLTVNNDYHLGLDEKELAAAESALYLAEQGRFEEILNLFKIEGNGENVNIDSFAMIVRLIDSLSLDKNTFSLSGLDLSGISEYLGVLDLTVTNGSVISIAAASSGILKEIAFSATTEEIAVPSSSSYLDYAGVGHLLAFVHNAMVGQGLAYNFQVAGLAEKEKLSGHFSLKYDEFDSSLTLSANYKNYCISLIYLNNRFYIAVNDAKIEIGYQALIAVVQHIVTALDKDTAELDSILDSLAQKQIPNFGFEAAEAISIDDLLTSFTYVGERLAVFVHYGEVSFSLSLTLDANLSAITIAFGECSLSLSATAYNKPEAFNNGLDVDSLATLSVETIAALYQKITSGVFELSLRDITPDFETLGSLLGIKIPTAFAGMAFSGSLYLNIASRDIRALLDVAYQNAVYPLDIRYIGRDKVVAANIFDSLYISDTVDNFIKLLSDFSILTDDEMAFDASSLIGTFLSIFNRLVTNINVEDDALKVSLDLYPLHYNDLATVSFGRDVININTGRTGEINMIAAAVQNIQKDESLSYLTAADLASYGGNLQKLVASPTFSLVIDGSYNGYAFGGIVKIDIGGKFDFAIDNLTISCPDFNVGLSLTKVGDRFYVDLGNTKMVLSIDELITLIYSAQNKFNLNLGNIDLYTLGEGIKLLPTDLRSGLALILKAVDTAQETVATNDSNELDSLFAKINIFEIIKNLRVGDSSIVVSIDLGEITSLVDSVSVTFDKNNAGLRLSSTGALTTAEGNANFGPGDHVDIQVPPTSGTWLKVAEIDNIMQKLQDVFSFLNKKQFSLTARGTILTGGQENFTYEASLKIDISSFKNIKMQLDATVIGPKLGSPVTHNFQIVMVDNSLYLVYNNKLKAFLSLNEVLQFVRYVTDVMNLSSPWLSSLLDGVTSGLDNDVFAPIIPEMKPLNLNINRFLKSLNVEKDGDILGDLVITADAEQMYTYISGFNPNLDADGNLIENSTNSIIKAAIGTGNGLIDNISVTNVYSQSGETFDISINFDNLPYENSDEAGNVDLGINGPSSTDGYYDFNMLTALAQTFFNSAGIASYSLSGNFEFRIIIPVIEWFTSFQSLPITIEIELDEKSVPTVHARLHSDKDVVVTVVTIFNRGTADIYYDGHTNMLYVKRTYGYKSWFTEKTATEYGTYSIADLGDSDKLAELILLILKPSSLVADQIKKQMNGSSFQMQNPIMFEDVLSSYSSRYENSSYSYGMTISGDSLVKNKQLSDITIDFSTLNSRYSSPDSDGNISPINKDYLSYLHVATEVMEMIAVKLSGSLTNVYGDKAPSPVRVSLPDNVSAGSGW